MTLKVNVKVHAYQQKIDILSVEYVTKSQYFTLNDCQKKP